jgi:hypothetical protein
MMEWWNDGIMVFETSQIEAKNPARKPLQRRRGWISRFGYFFRAD